MSDAAFNVLDALDEMKNAGFTEAQSRALTHSLQAVAASRQGDLATKADLHALESRLLKAINDQQRWTLGVMIVLVGVLFAAIRLL